MCANRILQCMRSVAAKETLSEFSIEITGTTKKGDGYMSDIIFVTVTGRTPSEERKVMKLAVKMSAADSAVRLKLPIREIFESEFYIYEHVVPAFSKFEEEMGVKSQSLDYVPICHATEFLEDCEILVLENLNPKGFSMWDRKKPMTYDHIGLVLRAYAQWHATSLAMRHKRREDFEKLAKNKIHLLSRCCISKLDLHELIYRQFGELCKAWRTDSEIKNIEFDKDEVKYIFNDLFSEDPDFHVILHGDSWNNNFMFKTEEETKRPKDVRIIDWQCTALSSPISDLSFFLYACVDTETHTDVKDMLKLYYDSLSERLRQVQCDPSEIFPYEKVLEHWRKFSKYGLLLGTYLVKFSLLENGEVPDITDLFEDEKNCKIANEQIYLKRGRSNILHYIKNLN